MRVRGREPIPRLEQVLAELPDTRITVELKSGAVGRRRCSTLLERTDSWHRVCLGSYHDGWLDRARRLAGPRLCTSIGQAVGVRAAQPGVAGRAAAGRRRGCPARR